VRASGIPAATPSTIAAASQPNVTCPATKPDDSTAVYALSARARAVPLNRTWMTLMICGIIAAVPAPWTNLAAMRISIPGAMPQASDACRSWCWQYPVPAPGPVVAPCRV
jgi:hypothetical protein